jgi:hypothetical protein
LSVGNGCKLTEGDTVIRIKGSVERVIEKKILFVIWRNIYVGIGEDAYKSELFVVGSDVATS